MHPTNIDRDQSGYLQSCSTCNALGRSAGFPASRRELASTSFDDLSLSKHLFQKGDHRCFAPSGERGICGLFFMPVWREPYPSHPSPARLAKPESAWCGGSEVRIIIAASSSCGLLNQSHTGNNNLLVSFRFRSSQTRSPQNDANFRIRTLERRQENPHRERLYVEKGKPLASPA
jgi:hypothetical protein